MRAGSLSARFCSISQDLRLHCFTASWSRLAHPGLRILAQALCVLAQEFKSRPEPQARIVGVYGPAYLWLWRAGGGA